MAPEAAGILRHQWEDVALPYWEGLAGFARRKGVRLAVEMHGRQLVYNPASFRRLQDAVGDDVVRVNLDPLAPSEAGRRTWNYVTLGQGHPGGAVFWRDFVYALRAVGYDGSLSIEHEDVIVSSEEGIRRAVEVLRPSIFRQPPDWSPAEV